VAGRTDSTKQKSRLKADIYARSIMIYRDNFLIVAMALTHQTNGAIVLVVHRLT